MIIQIVIAVIITIAILLQKSSSIGLGAYSGSNESLFGAKGPTGFLAKLTFVLGLLFIVNTLALGYLYNKDNTKTVTSTLKKSQKHIPAPTIPKKSTAPSSPAIPAKKISDK